MRRLGPAFAVLLGFAALPMSAQAQHVGYWKQSTPNGQSRDCRLVESQAALLEELRAVGWNLSSVPAIDWSDTCAIVIAPPQAYENHELAFYGIEWDGEDAAFYLKWGYAPVQKAGGAVQGADGSWSYSQGSSGGGPETMVVAFKHYMHASNKFFCRKNE